MSKIKLSQIVTFISLMIFPLTLTYFSPYLSVTGAFEGVISGSVLLFIALLLTAIFFRRTWCSTICPVSAIADYSEKINNRNVNRKKLRIIRYSIFTVWFSALVFGFVISFNRITINPFYLTENLLSIDEPLKFITYYLVLFVLITLTLVIVKRGACHSICWMSPFLVLGPQLVIRLIYLS
ncbi:MAG: 4Fe-4S binding protein [Ignavibacteria bacterium]|nr:4Fe-4S binding protein [Ignavibacteria bacterium]